MNCANKACQQMTAVAHTVGGPGGSVVAHPLHCPICGCFLTYHGACVNPDCTLVAAQLQEMGTDTSQQWHPDDWEGQITETGCRYLESLGLPMSFLATHRILDNISTARDCPYCETASVEPFGRCLNSNCKFAQQGAFVLPINVYEKGLSERDLRRILDKLGCPSDTMASWRSRMNDLLTPIPPGGQLNLKLHEWLVSMRDNIAIGYERHWLHRARPEYQHEIDAGFKIACENALSHIPTQHLLAVAAMEGDWYAFALPRNLLIPHLLDIRDLRRSRFWLASHPDLSGPLGIADVVFRGHTDPNYEPTALPPADWILRDRLTYLETLSDCLGDYCAEDGRLLHRDLCSQWDLELFKLAGLIIAYARAGGTIEPVMIVEEWASLTNSNLGHILSALGYPVMTGARCIEVLERGLLPYEVYAKWPEYAR